jgi:pimeloyl-ACP methyl ester carboxylesterase
MPDLRPFPNVMFYDNVRAQHELVTKHLGIKHARAILGWSMGAGQTYQWGTQYPEFMDLLAPFCGAAKTSLHNQAFLEGVKSTLYAAIGTSSAGVCKPTSLAPSPFSSHSFTRSPRETGLKALGRVYAGWGFSQAFYRERLFETAPKLGFKGLEDFMVNFWEAWALSKDPENMLVRSSLPHCRLRRGLIIISRSWRTRGKRVTAPLKSRITATSRRPCRASRRRRWYCQVKRTCTSRRKTRRLKYRT